jgi:quercetin dioxygenase-like cupin family protein
MALRHIRPGETVHLTRPAESEPRHQALVKTSQFEAIRLLLAAGEEIPEHHVGGFATVQCLRGSVTLMLNDKNVTMSSGDWLYLDQKQQHAVRAIDDTTLLLTIMLDGVSSR